MLDVRGAPGLEPGFITSLTKQYDSPDAVMAFMIYTFTHPIIAGILLAGALAAAMSTLDSFLATVSLLLTRDIYQRLNPRAGELSLILISRALILAFALIGWYLVIRKPGLIFDIVAIAAGGGLQVLPRIIASSISNEKGLYKQVWSPSRFNNRIYPCTSAYTADGEILWNTCTAEIPAWRGGIICAHS